MKVSIIIPVYNEEKTVATVIANVKKVKHPMDREIIAINDGSTDKSLQILKKIPGIVLLENQTNRGKGYSIRKAISKATGDIILIHDADLEYDPNEHIKILKHFSDDTVNVVYGSRFLNKNHHARYQLFYLGNIFLSFITRILYLHNISDMETCYKAIRKSAIKEIKLYEYRFGFEPEITCKLIKAGQKIIEVPITYKSRSFEDGKKIGIKDGLRAIYVLLKYRFVN